jgi:hypothetical protein
LAVLALVAARHWPFTRAAITKSLQEQSGSQVQIATFRQTFFPHPGCVAENVTFRHGPSSGTQPFMTLQRLTVVGSYTGLLTHHISQIRAEQLHLLISRGGQNAGGQSSPLQTGSTTSGVSIGQIIADGARIEIIEEDGSSQPLVITAPRLSVNNIADSHPFSYHAVVMIPEPRGVIDVSGRFGPWKSGDPGQTPLSGSYALQHADLSVFGGIAGILDGQGKFSGVLQRIQTDGTTDVPDFELTDTRRPVHLATSFHVLVNGLNGDVVLQPLLAHTGKTTVVFAGDIASPSKGTGKTISVDMDSAKARVQDILRPFVSDSQPPMTGSITFRSRVNIPSGKGAFLDRIHLDGDFGIAGGQYTNPETQKNVDVMSARAEGKADQVEDKEDKDHNNYDPGRVISNVKGHVQVRRGVAHLTNLSFDVPGASALVNGTFDLHNEHVKMDGTAHIEAELSQATTGVKSVLLKLIQPLAHKKKEQGSTVEVKVAGTYQNPSFTVLPAASPSAQSPR